MLLILLRDRAGEAPRVEGAAAAPAGGATSADLALGSRLGTRSAARGGGRGSSPLSLSLRCSRGVRASPSLLLFGIPFLFWEEEPGRPE